MKDTFPATPPFSEWVDWSALTHTAELILDGKFSDSELQGLSQDRVNHMERRTNIKESPCEITAQDWEGKIKAWLESTSTSPSDFHLTHSKVLFARSQYAKDTDEHSTFEAKRDTLIQYQVELINLALRNGYSFDRWKHVVNVMILKEPGNYKIHRLRIIHLYEHDFNGVLAIKWRKLIQQSNAAGNLNAGQYGAVPGKNTVTPNVLEELQYEISRASKWPLIHFDLDLTACYDRIVLNLGSLISRAHGQHKKICLVHANTLKEAEYKLKTQLRLSKDSYKHSELFPIFCSGQGAGNSPHVWC